MMMDAPRSTSISYDEINRADWPRIRMTQVAMGYNSMNSWLNHAVHETFMRDSEMIKNPVFTNINKIDVYSNPTREIIRRQVKTHPIELQKQLAVTTSMISNEFIMNLKIQGFRV